MRQLSESRINKNSAYRVVRVDNSVVRFMTDAGLLYEAGFVDDCTFFEENAYQFYLKELTGTSSARDVKIMDTVGAIIEDFFYQNESIVVYICDDSDGRQSARNRLFVSWYNSYPKKEEYTLLTGQGSIGGSSYFAAAIVAKKNPDYEEIINAFSFFKMELKAKFPDAEID